MVTTTTFLDMQRTPDSDVSEPNPNAVPLTATTPSTADQPCSSEPVKNLKRTRKAHSKVRTGCLTCKIRRKKCDETKPACLRCTSTGRKCDGYAPPQTQTQAQAQIQQAPSPAPVLAPVSRAVQTLRPHVTQAPLAAVVDAQSKPIRNHGMGRMKLAVAGGLPAATILMQEEVEELRGDIVQDDELIESVPGCKALDTLLPAGRNVGSGYGTPQDSNTDAVEDEELEDFILSYRTATTTTSPTPAPPSATSSFPDHAISPHSEVASPSASSLSLQRRRLLPSQRTLTPLVSMAPSQYLQISDLERHCFTFFRYRTGPSFASYFDSSIWRTYIIRAALAHPVVLSCAAAVGAAHRRLGYGISREAFEYCAHADNLHKKALRGLAKLKRNTGNSLSMGLYDRDVIMTSEMLLGLFEGFQGEYNLAVAHMNNGLKYLLGRPMTLVHSESQYCAVEPKPNSFCHLFHRLHCRALQLFDAPANILVHWGEGRSLPSIPDIFESLEEARDFLFTEVDWIMHAPARVWQDVRERSEAQNLHVGRLLKWSVSYADMVRDMERTPRQKRACMLMKLTRNATYLLLYLTLFVQVDIGLPRMPRLDVEIEDDPVQDSDLAYATKRLWEAVERREELNTNLARVKILVEGILDENGIFNYDEHSLSFDSAIGPPRYTSNEKLAVPEASGKTRHMVKQLVHKKADDHALWQMLGVYGVAEKISAVEEHAVIDAVKSIIPESVDPRWVDITCMMESRKILLRYCRPDDYGLGMMWTQEWWTF